ncbi:MAG: DUF3305 domain-containing protein [Gammaproteobacteria bacterium]|nr:DUF3305 domain-containing protein [Gammaproteobacteria bacterium]
MSVIMQQTPVTGNPWIDHKWEAVGVMVGQQGDSHEGGARVIHSTGQTRQVLYGGFEVRLHMDECESYYHNLVSPRPRCYVVVRADDDGVPVPSMVSISFDQANAFLEADEDVFPVDLTPELYRWMELFVLDNYIPVKRVKRKRENWKGKGGGM